MDLTCGGSVQPHLHSLLPLADVLRLADLQPALSIKLSIREVPSVFGEVVAPSISPHSIFLPPFEATPIDRLRGYRVILIFLQALLSEAGLLALSFQVAFPPVALPFVSLGSVLAFPLNGVIFELSLVYSPVAVGHLPGAVLFASAETALIGHAIGDDLPALSLGPAASPLSLVFEDDLLEVLRCLSQAAYAFELSIKHLAFVVGAIVEDEDGRGVGGLCVLDAPVVVASVVQF